MTTQTVSYWNSKRDFIILTAQSHMELRKRMKELKDRGFVKYGKVKKEVNFFQNIFEPDESKKHFYKIEQKGISCKYKVAMRKPK